MTAPTVEQARRRYLWEAFRLSNEESWRHRRTTSRTDDQWWESIGVDVDAASLAYDNAVAEAVHGDEREPIAWA